MTDTAFILDDFVKTQLAGWQRDLGAVRGLAPNTLEGYGRDLSGFLAFLGQHTGGPVSLTTLKEMRAADIRAWMASRRDDDIQSRSLARGLSAIKSFFRFLEREGVMATEALNVIRTPKAKKSLPKALTMIEARATIATPDDDALPWVAARDMAVLALCYGPACVSPRLSPSRAPISTAV